MPKNDRVIRVPGLAATGSELRGTSMFLVSQVKTITKRMRARRFGPNKTDFDDLAYLVQVQADALYELGGALQTYDRYLKSEYGIDLRLKTIEKSQFEI